MNSGARWEGKLKSAAVNNCKREGLWYREAARCPFLSINVLCAPTRVPKNFSLYKLEIFSDGYASPKFIPHKIFKNEIVSERIKGNYGTA